MNNLLHIHKILHFNKMPIIAWQGKEVDDAPILLRKKLSLLLANKCQSHAGKKGVLLSLLHEQSSRDTRSGGAAPVLRFCVSLF